MPTPDALKKTHPFNVQMSQNEMGMLQQIAGERGESKAKVLRDLLDSSWRMRFNNQPQCADCTSCKCPSMHSIQPTERMTTPELYEQKKAQDEAENAQRTDPDGYQKQ